VSASVAGGLASPIWLHDLRRVEPTARGRPGRSLVAAKGRGRAARQSLPARPARVRSSAWLQLPAILTPVGPRSNEMNVVLALT
jgi:hypothetical protein